MHAKSYFAFILGFCVAVLSVPALASGVSTTVLPTTGYHVVNNSTVALPQGSTVSAVKDITPQVTRYPNGLQQSMAGTATINGLKQPVPLSLKVRATTANLRAGAARALKSGKVTPANLLFAAGLQELLNGVGWIMGEGGQAQKMTPVAANPISGGWHLGDANAGLYSSAYEACMSTANRSRWESEEKNCTGTFRMNDYVFACTANIGGCGTAFLSTIVCPESAPYDSITGMCSQPNFSPAEPADIDDLVASYDPDPADWPLVGGYVMPSDVVLTDIPTVHGSPKTKTIYDANGNPIAISETNIWFDFDISNNPSTKPKVDLKTTEETTTYENGQKTGSTKTTTTSEGVTNNNSNFHGSEPEPQKIDCELFPTACAWMDWTQESPVEPPDADLSGLLQEINVTMKTHNITGIAAACPAPIDLDLGIYGSPKIKYDPFCDLAITMKPFYLALMAFLSSMIIWRSIV